MNITDIIIVISVGIFSLIGFLKGFLRTVISPLSSLVGLYGGYVYYLKKQQFLPALAIAILGPIALTLIIHSLLFLWRKNAAKEQSLSSTSRILGGLFNATWGLCIFFPLLWFIAIMPAPFEQLTTVKNDVRESSFYSFLRQVIDRKFSTMNDVEVFLKDSQDPARLEAMQSKPEYETLRNDPRFQDLLNDDETVRQIRERDIVKLMTNQKFIAVLRDKETMKKLFDLSKGLGENAPRGTPAPEPSPPSYVKVYELKDGTKVGETQNGAMEVLP